MLLPLDTEKIFIKTTNATVTWHFAFYLLCVYEQDARTSTHYLMLGRAGDSLGSGEYSGYYSRRINKEHRLIYKVTEKIVYINCAYGHYLLKQQMPQLRGILLFIYFVCTSKMLALAHTT